MVNKWTIEKIYEQDKNYFAAEDEHFRKLILKGLYPKHFIMPLALQFELTYQCNLRCLHCYNNSGANCNKDRMTPDKWVEFAHYIVDKGGIFECILSGGEPLLLGNRLFEIMDILDKDGTFFHLISNGYLMTRDIAKKLSKYRFKWVQISIDDANDSEHDAFRGKQGSWEKAVNAVFYLVNEGIPVAIAHSVTPRNFEKLEDMCRLTIELGASTLIVGDVTGSGRAYSNSDILLNKEQKEQLTGLIIELRNKYKNILDIQRTTSTKIQLKRFSNLPNTGAIIRPNGDIRLDCMTPFIMGNILEEDFFDVWTQRADKVWKSQKMREYIEKYEDFNEVNQSIKNYVDSDILITGDD